MEPHCLRLGELPRTTKLFSDYLDSFPRVSKFFEHPPDEAGVIAAARKAQIAPETRRTVTSVLRQQSHSFGSDAVVEKNIERLEKGAVAVVTGQQVGLFSGPAYSFFKALTAVRWAERLTVKGIDAVPVFWLATEDHDLAEVDHSFWLTRNGVERLHIETPPAFAGHEVGQITFGPEIAELVDKAAAALSGRAAREVERALRESYAPGENFGSAFGKLMARLLAGRGVILLDPLDEQLHRIAAPVFRRAVDECVTLRDELLARNKALDKAGYQAQVKVTAEATLLFMNVDGKREPVRFRNDKYRAGGVTISPGELLHAIDETPEIFSPNVLLRAAVQDTFLPTAAYIGGPSEIAYMAQVEVVYRKLLGRMPAILPRAGFTLVEPHVARLLQKYGMSLPDIFAGRQRVHAALASGSVPRGLAGRFNRDERTFRRALKAYAKPLARLDKSLVGALEMAERKILYQLSKLGRKAGRAEGFRSGIIERHERLILDSLYPQREPQERSLCLLPFLASYGLELLDELYKHAGVSPPQHHVLWL